MNSSVDDNNTVPVLFLEVNYPWMIVAALSLSVSAVVGSLGNILVILVILFVRNLRTSGNLIVLNLALADLVVTLLVDPFNVVGAVAGRRVLLGDPALCEWIASFCAPSCMGSMWNMCAISLNRYILICYPHLYDNIFTTRSTILMCVWIWIMCHLFHLPNYFGWGKNRFITAFYLCSFDAPYHPYAIFYITTGVIIPLSGVLFGYANIYYKVRSVKMQLRQHKDVQPEDGSTDVGRTSRRPVFNQEDIRLIKTLFKAFALFFICWAPFALVLLAHLPSTIPAWVYVVIMITAHGNSAVNPICMD